MRIIMLIGASGAGKSTWAAGFPEGAVVSSDEVRKWVFGNTANQHPSIWRVIRAIIRAKIESGCDTLVIDATFAKKRDRVSMINDVRSWMPIGATLEGLYFDVPKNVLKERNATRERQVPNHAIDAQYSALQANPPSEEDGFDMLVTVKV